MFSDTCTYLSHVPVISLQWKQKQAHIVKPFLKTGKGNMQMESEKISHASRLMVWTCSELWRICCSIYKYHRRHYTSPLCTLHINCGCDTFTRQREAQKSHHQQRDRTAPTCQQKPKKCQFLYNIQSCRDYADLSTASHYTLVIQSGESLIEDILSRFTGAHVTKQTWGHCQTLRLNLILHCRAKHQAALTSALSNQSISDILDFSIPRLSLIHPSEHLENTAVLQRNWRSSILTTMECQQSNQSGTIRWCILKRYHTKECKEKGQIIGCSHSLGQHGQHLTEIMWYIIKFSTCLVCYRWEICINDGGQFIKLKIWVFKPQ